MSPDSVFNYVLGALTLAGFLTTYLVYINVFLNTPQLKSFDDMLRDTKNIYEDAITEGLLSVEMSLKAKSRIREAMIFEPPPSRPSTLFRRGTKLTDLSKSLSLLHTELVTTSQEERARRRINAEAMQEGNRCPLPASTSDENEDDTHSSYEEYADGHAGNPFAALSNFTPKTASPPTCRVSFCPCWLLERFLYSHRETPSSRLALPLCVEPQGDPTRPLSSMPMDVLSRSSTMVAEPLSKPASVANGPTARVWERQTSRG
ncbi:hypothetical protein H0H81_000869 [Sphagnurus paluster]|uniref:Uncharacterized protein n=1 Tax=Sphagnurus paluster TaxID=117069 RepID=A0A9P7KK69_9AGAR|nr:hypothetical protein H0H81_000869 [Sphagnurus paluster]